MERPEKVLGIETNDENKDIEHSKSDIQQNKRRGVKFKKQL